jgi:hypothetical protein
MLEHQVFWKETLQSSFDLLDVLIQFHKRPAIKTRKTMGMISTNEQETPGNYHSQRRNQNYVRRFIEHFIKICSGRINGIWTNPWNPATEGANKALIRSIGIVDQDM